jgi:trk system potassium uptake protein TrkH
VITVFMFLAGINFSLHYAFLRGRFKSYFRDDEFRIYLSVAVAATLVIMAINWRSSGYGWLENLRFSSFQSVSIMTTTGYVTADYEAWGSAAQYVLLSLMFVGGCAGSTGGGMKNVRLLLLSRHALIELRKLIHPRGVYFIRFNGRAVSQEVQTNILGFFLLLVITTLTATFAMTMLGLDLVSAFGSVAATLNNIGPGLGTVGPTDHFGHLPVMGKWILMFCMLLGRLELFTVLVLLTPDFWKRV